MKAPIIGIVSRACRIFNTIDIQGSEETYRNAVLKMGGIPFTILPTQQVSFESIPPKDVPRMTLEEQVKLNRTLNLCDGILMPGGLKTYEYDYYIYNYAITNNIPILGICAGMQIMARANGNAQILKNDTPICHFDKENTYAHNIEIEQGSLLYEILGQSVILVNSYHNYHIESLRNFKVDAISGDGMIESISNPAADFCLGVQWHPEKLIEQDENSQKIMKYFINCSEKHSKLR